MEERSTDRYRLWQEQGSGIVHLEGTIRLSTKEIEGLRERLEGFTIGLDAVHLSLRELAFLNSSGVNMLVMLAFKLRKQGTPLRIDANEAHSWQKRSLRNVNRAYPEARLEFR